MIHLNHSLATVFVLLSLCVLIPSPSMAHRVNVFAWVEANQVCVLGSFSRSNPARKAQVTIYDGQKTTVLAQGSTDESGLYRFDLPPSAKETGLFIELNAGEGHQNSWQLSKEDCQTSSAVSLPQITENTERSGQQPESNEANLRTIIREEVQSAIRPLLTLYAEEKAKGPGFIEIIGGIGWLFGFFGLLAFFSARKHKG